MVRDLKLEIETSAKDLAERIRDYSRSQKDLWQQVPFIAYVGCAALIEIGESDAYDLYLDGCYCDVAQNGYWGVGSLSPPHNLNYFTYVDLETGELVELGKKGGNRPAQDSYVLRLANRLHELDAHGLVNRLKADAGELGKKPNLLTKMQDCWSGFYHRKESKIKNQQFLDTITF